VKTTPFQVPGIHIVYEDDTVDISITNVPHQLLLKNPLDCPIIVENSINVVTDEV